MPPEISIVIVHYNNLPLLLRCLRSIDQAGLEESEVIVVDNHSTTGDVAAAVRPWPRLRLLTMPKNEGFARGNNFGIAQARGQYVFLLNQDAELVGQNWRSILGYFERDGSLAAIQPKILIAGSTQINTCGLKVQYLGFAWDHHYRTPADSISQPESLAAFSGAAVILRKAALDRVGNFDQRYFMYHEDVDLSFRLRWVGLDIRLQPELVVTHQYSFKRDAQRYYYLERNRLLTLIKNYPAWLLLALLPAGLVMELGMVYFSLTNGWLLKKLQSYFGVLGMLPGALRHRAQRAISPAVFFAPIVGPVVFAELQHPLLQRLANPFLAWYWGWIRRFVVPKHLSSRSQT